jgi:hypothetical protein
MDQAISAGMPPINWDLVWQTVAAQLSADELTPRFPTEDGIRVAALRALQARVSIVLVADIEYGAVNLGGGQSDRLDLVIQGACRCDSRGVQVPAGTVPGVAAVVTK